MERAVQALGLDKDANEDEISQAITAAAVSAVEVARYPGRETSTPLDLNQLYNLVSDAHAASSLDVLNLLSILLPCKEQAAKELITLMGKFGSSREIIMAAQEEIERLCEKADLEEEFVGDEASASFMEQLITLVELCHTAIRRLSLRRKTASETLEPLLLNIRKAMTTVGHNTNSPEARSCLNAITSTVQGVFDWVQGLPGATSEENQKCQALLKTVLDDVLVSFRDFIKYSSVQRAFEMCFPRLIIPTVSETPSQEGQLILAQFQSLYATFGYTPKDLIESPSTSSLILLAHAWTAQSTPVPQIHLLSSFRPHIIMALQTNSSILEDALALLFLTLYHNQSGDKVEVAPDIVTSFLPFLVTLSSAHPSPRTRHQAFRILGLLLASGPPQLRFQLLSELVARCEYPQMRVAAVGLVKDAVLEALSNPKASSSSRNPFGSQMFMRVFGPLLFAPSPSDLFQSRVDLDEFWDSPEPKRLVEVLSLYYVVLVRDAQNATGIRDEDMLNTVDKNLLTSLKGWLEEHSRGAGLDDHGHPAVSLVALQMALNRIDEAKSNLSSKSTS